MTVTRPATARLGVAALAGAALLLVVPRPAAAAAYTFRVQTVPEIAGVEFELDGRRFVSNERGLASIGVDAPGRHVLEVLDRTRAADVRPVFSRWTDVYDRKRMVTVPQESVLAAGFDVSYPVTTEFVDPEGDPIDDATVSYARLKGSNGDFIRVTPGKPVWLKASRVVRSAFGLEVAKLTYSVERVVVKGSNVVTRFLQQFGVKPNGEPWKIELIYFPLRFDARDVLLDTPIGSHAMLEFPDGSVRRIPLDDEGKARVAALPRGTYTAWVDAPGYAPPVPISLSKAGQEASLIVITYADAVIMVVAALACILGPPTLGRLARRRLGTGRADPRPG